MSERPLEQPPAPDFAPSAMVVLDSAKQEALNFRHPYVGTEHLLIGLMQEDTARDILVAHFPPDANILGMMRNATEFIVGRDNQTTDGEELETTKRYKKVIELAQAEAVRHESPRIESTHILTAIAQMRQGVAVAVLELNGVDLSDLRPVFGEISTDEIDFAINRLRTALANTSLPDEDRLYLIDTIHDLLNLIEDESEGQV